MLIAAAGPPQAVQADELAPQRLGWPGPGDCTVPGSLRKCCTRPLALFWLKIWVPSELAGREEL